MVSKPTATIILYISIFVIIYTCKSFFRCWAGEPYDNLKRTLRAEIDEDAWSSLYSTVSRPFDKSETGKFAVKVINHYGDEVLKVFEI